MLKIYFGEMDEAIFNTSVYFKNVYRDDWITEPIAREMIKDVDKSTVIDSGVIDSPVMGKIPPTSLSGGVKTLILIRNIHDKIFNASTCGDNCSRWLLKLAENDDVIINLRHIMNFGDESFRIYVMNDDKIVTNMKDMVMTAGLYV